MEHILLKVIFQLTLIVVTAGVFAGLFRKIGQPEVCG